MENEAAKPSLRLNALAGIFVFLLADNCELESINTYQVSMPSRAFLFSYYLIMYESKKLYNRVSMPSRAFLFSYRCVGRVIACPGHGVSMPSRAFLFSYLRVKLGSTSRVRVV